MAGQGSIGKHNSH